MTAEHGSIEILFLTPEEAIKEGVPGDIVLGLGTLAPQKIAVYRDVSGKVVNALLMPKDIEEGQAIVTAREILGIKSI